MRLHLVDGTYELFRAYFGAPKAFGRQGAEVGATRGLLRSMLFLLGEPGVTHVGVAFDHVIESFRNDLFDGYKTSAGVPETAAQFRSRAACNALGSWYGRWWNERPTTPRNGDGALAAPSESSRSSSAPRKGHGACGAAAQRAIRPNEAQGLRELGVSKFGVATDYIPDCWRSSATLRTAIPRDEVGRSIGAAKMSAYPLRGHSGERKRMRVNVRGAASLAEPRDHRDEGSIPQLATRA